jgi:hypothetical protein
MSISYTISRGVASSAGSAALSGSYLAVGSSEQAIDQTFAAASSNVAQAASFGAHGTASGDLVAIELLASAPVTILTNSTTAPQDTIALAASVPLQWDSQSGLACPFAGAVTEFYVSATNAARLQGRILVA